MLYFLLQTIWESTKSWNTRLSSTGDSHEIPSPDDWYICAYAVLFSSHSW